MRALSPFPNAGGLAIPDFVPSFCGGKLIRFGMGNCAVEAGRKKLRNY
jgi:hypothetical protein